jgi:hypothetical protein
MMAEETTKNGIGGPTPALEGRGSDTATKVSTSEKKNFSPFVHTGKAELSHQALHVSYRAFNEDHDVYIGMTDLAQLMSSRFTPAAPVKEIRIDVAGVESTEKIGYAARTISGKALKINTIHSGGDLLLPWSNLAEIVNHKRNSAPVSRLVVPEAPKPAPARDIREGLEGGF